MLQDRESYEPIIHPALRREKRCCCASSCWDTVLLAGLAGVWMIAAPRPAFPHDGDVALNAPGDPEHGRAVFNAGDCASCHASPGQPDRLRLGGGLALASPLGIFLGPTSRPIRSTASGLAHHRPRQRADERRLARPAALLSGAALHLLCPYARGGCARPDGLSAHAAAGARAGRRRTNCRFPFNIRRGHRASGSCCFSTADPITADPAHDATWNRGRYLVEALGHCAECHSTRNVLGAVEASTRFAGGPESAASASCRTSPRSASAIGRRMTSPRCCGRTERPTFGSRLLDGRCGHRTRRRCRRPTATRSRPTSSRFPRGRRRTPSRTLPS